MKKITKDQREGFRCAAVDLQENANALNEAIANFNIATAAEFEKVNDRIKDYNKTIDAIDEIRIEVSQSISDYIGDRSAKWQIGGQGERFDSWLEEWRDAYFEKIFIDQSFTIEIDKEYDANVEQIGFLPFDLA